MAWQIEPITVTSGAPRKIRLIPFIYSSDVVYMVELGNEYMRFFYGDEVLKDEGDEEIWIATPYKTEHLFELQYKQVGDVMRITHPSYQTRTLRRTSETSFDLQIIPFAFGPFLVRHDIDSDDGVTLQSSVSGALEGTVSYSLKAAYGYSGSNHIKDNWWNGNAAYALGSDSDYCGGGRVPTWGNMKAWITYTITLPKAISSIDEITISYICMATHSTKTNLRLWDGDSWIDVVDENFDETTYYSKPKTLVGKNDTATITQGGPWSDISKIEIFLGATGSGTSAIACALFNVIASTGISERTGTLTASSSLFQSGHIGSLFQLVHPRLKTTSSGTETAPQGTYENPVELFGAINVKGDFRFTTSGNWTGTVTLQRRENSLAADDWENFRTYTSGDPPDLNVNQPFVEDNYNVEYRARVYLPEGGGKISATLTVADSMQTGIVRIDGVTNETVASITMITMIASTDATKRWAEGCWSGVRGYPASCTFIEERCVYAGMNIQTSGAKLLKVWPSRSGDYNNFDKGNNNADSFDLTIPTTETISWIEAMDNLIVATGSDTWFIRSSKIDTPLVPVPPPIVRRQSGYNCDPIQPVDGGKAMLYISGRQVRELGYEKESAQYDADLTALAEHFTQSPIIGISMQYNPCQILWCHHEDGTLSVLVYEREQNCVGWAHILIDGEVQSVCVTPGEDVDDIWLAVKRHINDEDVIYIEKIKPIFFNADTNISDLFYVDCGITFTSETATDTITGLGHLIGETVVALCSGVISTEGDPPIETELGDGVVYAGLTVTASDDDGIATLPEGITITKAQVGLAYDYKCQPMRIILNTPRGTTMGSTMKINKFTVSFLDTMGAKFGAIENDLRPFDWVDPKYVNNSEIAGLFTGDIDAILDGAYNAEAPIIIGGNSPLPCTIRAIIPRIEVTGA